MAVVKRARAGGKAVYGVSNEWNGKSQWELVGPSKREAEIRDRAMKKEIEAGTYIPKAGARATTFGAFADSWINARTNQSCADEERHVRLYLRTRPWLADRRLDEVKVPDRKRLIRELRAETKTDGSRRLTDKTIGNAIGTFHLVFKAAIESELCVLQPFARQKGELDTSSDEEVEIYEPAEVRVLTRHHSIPWPIRTLNGLCSLAGLREGEAVGLRFGDLDTETQPLPSFIVRRQYEGRKLKTKRPRVVPVHPELWQLLKSWGEEGFELYTGRKPTQEDFIVPNCSSRAKQPHHTRSSYYKQFVKHAEAAGIRTRSLHATRHTFISLCRRGGARKDVLERVTHNAKGGIIDRYTHFDFEPLCEAVLCLRLDAHRSMQSGSGNAGNSGATLELPAHPNSGESLTIHSGAQASIPGASTSLPAKNSREKKARQETRQESERIPDEFRDGLAEANRRRKRRLLSLDEADPVAAGPGLALCRAVDDATPTWRRRLRFLGLERRWANEFRHPPHPLAHPLSSRRGDWGGIAAPWLLAVASP
jgi:integrase